MNSEAFIKCLCGGKKQRCMRGLPETPLPKQWMMVNDATQLKNRDGMQLICMAVGMAFGVEQLGGIH